MDTTPQALKSKLFKLQTRAGQQTWVQKCQGYPSFRKQDNIFKLKYFALPSNQLYYQISVNSNIDFTSSQNGFQWTQIKQSQVMAISFKQEFSARAFWKLIEQYKRNYAVTVAAANDTLFYFEYRVPDPSSQNINEVYQQLQNIPENQRHQRVASIFLTKRQLLPKLMNVFKSIENQQKNQNIEKLQTIFKIVRIIFNAANEEMLYELMSSDYYMFLLDDPNFKNCRPQHRQFMKTQSKLLEVVPFKNSELLNLVIFTYRLEYVKQCVLSPYLSDSAIITTTVIVKNNYRKILSHIFNPKKKDFINQLFDLMRSQDLQAFKLLRQVFRIAKSINTQEIYLYIAQRDFFQIMIRNMKEQKNYDENLQNTNSANISSIKKTKKKSKQTIQQIVNVCLEILQQFMENQPLHFKNYCMSDSQMIYKFPTIEFFLDNYQNSHATAGQKICKILKILVECQDGHKIKEITHDKILQKFLQTQSISHYMKWIPIFSKIIKPMNPKIDQQEVKIQIIAKLCNHLGIGPKFHQIETLICLRQMITTYFTHSCDINKIAETQSKKLANFLAKNNGNIGIRQSIVFSIFSNQVLKSVSYRKWVQNINEELGKISQVNQLVFIYIETFKMLLNKKQVELPTNLKRQRSQKQLLDQQNFEKIEKKNKIQ